MQNKKVLAGILLLCSLGVMSSCKSIIEPTCYDTPSTDIEKDFPKPSCYVSPVEVENDINTNQADSVKDVEHN